MSCPICDKETSQKYRPFCSARCADVDLGRWLTGAYAIPTQEAPGEDLSQFAEDPDDKKLH